MRLSLRWTAPSKPPKERKMKNIECRARLPQLLTRLALRTRRSAFCVPHSSFGISPVPLLALAAWASCALCAAAPPEPPRAAVREHVQVIHGQERRDPYHWLRERDDPEVIRYLEAENAYTEAMLAHTTALQERLFEEMKARIPADDQSVPARDGPYEYYHRNVAGKQYRIHCRRRAAPDAPEEILLDENVLAEGREYFSLGAVEVSPDHRLLAYSVDYEGSEKYTLRIRDLESGRDLPDAVDDTYYGLAWTSDNAHVLYTTLDDALRPYRVHLHRLGAPASEDRLLYEEPDERFHVYVERSRSGSVLLVTVESQITTEVLWLPADDPSAELRPVRPREQGVEYSVDHHGEHFYMLTNKDAVNFRLLRGPMRAAADDDWTEVVPHDDAVTLLSVSAFQDFLAIEQRRDGLSGLRLIDLRRDRTHELAFPEPAYVVGIGENLEFDTGTLRYEYSSLVTPDSVYDLDVETLASELRKRRPIGSYEPERYAAERLFAPAPDGVKVPISLVYRRDLHGASPQPLLLDGYGSYGASNEPSFTPWIVSLLDRGMIYAVAHVRGGGEMGRHWYLDGKMRNKRNTITDFIACAEHLVARGYTAPDRLAAVGGSAGGLLMGAVANERPDLFRALLAHVPFVDVVNTMLDDTIPLTVIEYEEWGNPNQREDYQYMMTYSPYDNVRPQAYPHMLITAGLNDPRVQYWEPAKWCARLRAVSIGDNRLLLRTNMGAGHGGASGRYDRLRERAMDFAFLLDVLGIRE